MPEKTISQQLADAQAQLTTLNGQVATLTQERDTARTEKDSAVQAATAPLQASITTLTGERDQARTDLATANATITAKDGEITTLKANAKTSGQGALEIAASQVTPPVGSGKETPGAVGDENAWTKYQELMAKSPGEATAFYNANKAKVIADSKKK